MDHLVYIAAAGAGEAMLAQGVNSNNLANASTTGFRANLLTAQSVYTSTNGLGSRVHVLQQGQGVDFSKGAINATGNNLDVAINGDGWIAVARADGSEALSRRGDLRVNELGQVTNGAGMQVMGNGGPIALPPYSSVEVGADGTVSIVPLGEDPNTLAVVDRIKLVNPEIEKLHKGIDGLVQMISGEEAIPDANVTLISGALEASNVDSVGAMVHMIELSRQFENHAKMMKVAEQLDQASAELMSMS